MARTRIVTDASLHDGRPVVAGTDVTVEHVLERLAAGDSLAALAAKNPGLSGDGIRAALAHAADVLRASLPEAAPARGARPPAGEIDLSRPIDLVVLAVKDRAARCRLPGAGAVITLRAPDLHRVVPGQTVAVQPRKQWSHKGHPYLSGEILAARIDVAALGLAPLALRSEGDWDPDEAYWGEEDDGVPAWARAIVARGPRPAFEMEQVLPGEDPDDPFTDPILEAVDAAEAGDDEGARKLLGRLLEVDLRCLDAHAHLGNRMFAVSPVWALLHYEVGVRIGEAALGGAFDGVLPWGLVHNRPFLRCLQGFGLCLWRLERWEEARGVFERMLWLNPGDEQGIRFVLPLVTERTEWSAEVE